MSALWAPTSDQAAREHEVERPFLRGLPRPAPRLARVPFLLVLIALFAVGMTGLLMLNTTLQNQAFQVSTLNRQASELAYTQADLESRIDRLSAPQELARRASAAGLRPNPYPAFLVLPKGKVVGKPQPVTGAEAPTLVIKTPAELAADKAAAAAERKAAAIRRKAEAAAAAAEAKAAKKAAKEKKAAPKQAGPKKPVANKPAAKKPPADKPAAKKPAAKKPAAKKPAAKKPARSGGG